MEKVKKYKPKIAVFNGKGKRRVFRILLSLPPALIKCVTAVMVLGRGIRDIS